MMDSALWGALITGGLGIVGVIVAKCRCYAKTDDNGECIYGAGFTEVPLAPQPNEIEQHSAQQGDLLYIKKNKHYK